MSIGDYLRGCVGFSVEDNAIDTILLDRDVAPYTPVETLSKKTKDLCRADLYMWCASTPSVKGAVYDADGGWKHQESGWESSAYDKRTLREMANTIYAQYQEPIVSAGINVIKGRKL